MRELYKALPAEASVDSGLERPVPAQAVQLRVQAALGRALRAWCSPPWASARRCLRMTLPSLPRWERSIKQHLSLICEFTGSHCCSSILARLISALPKLLRPAPAFRLSSTTTARPQTARISIFLPPSDRCTGSHSNSNCFLDSALAQIFVICG